MAPMTPVDFSRESTQIDGTQAVKVLDELGNPFTTENPLPVSTEQSEGTEVQDHNDDDVSPGVPHDHDYTVPVGKVFVFTAVLGSSSVSAKITIQSAADGSSFVTHAARFNDRPPGLDAVLPAVTLPAGGKVRITRKNRSGGGSPVSISTTILGVLHDA